MAILLEALHLGKIFSLNAGRTNKRRLSIKFLGNLFFVCFVCFACLTCLRLQCLQKYFLLHFDIEDQKCLTMHIRSRQPNDKSFSLHGDAEVSQVNILAFAGFETM